VERDVLQAYSSGILRVMYEENPIICVLIQLPLLSTEEGQKCSMWTRGQFPPKNWRKMVGEKM
jgi:hypothetical protein